MKQLLSCLITGLALLAISGCSAPLHSQTSFNKLVWSDDGIIAYQEMKQKYVILEKRVKELDNKNLILSQEIRLLQSDDKYIETMIRKRLNFVRENEILYVFPDSEATDSEAVKLGAGLDESKN